MQTCPGVCFTESPHAYIVAARPAFNCSLRHVHHAAPVEGRIQIERLPMSRMLARYCRHACSSEPPDATPRHARYAPAAVLMPALCVSGCAWIPVHSSGIIFESQPTFCLYGARIASRLARGKAPSNPGKPKGRECIQANPSCVLSS